MHSHWPCTSGSLRRRGSRWLLRDHFPRRRTVYSTDVSGGRPTPGVGHRVCWRHDWAGPRLRAAGPSQTALAGASPLTRRWRLVGPLAALQWPQLDATSPISHVRYSRTCSRQLVVNVFYNSSTVQYVEHRARHAQNLHAQQMKRAPLSSAAAALKRTAASSGESR